MAKDKDDDTDDKKKDKGKEKEKPFTFACRACGTQRKLGGNCPACGAAEVPEDTLRVNIREGQNGYLVIVQTFRNKQKVKAIIIFDLEGEDPKVVETTDDGLAIIEVMPYNQRRTVKVSMIDTPAVADEVVVPRLRPKKPLSREAPKNILARWRDWGKKAESIIKVGTPKS